MRSRLTNIFVYPIVGDEAARGTGGTERARGRLSGTLRVNERVVVRDVGKQSGARLHVFLPRHSEIGQGRMVLGIIGSRPSQRILQRNGQRSSVRGRIAVRSRLLDQRDGGGGRLCKKRRRCDP